MLSSTLTTVAVFLPIVFIQQEAGQLFRDIALAISAAVFLSMIVSMTGHPGGRGPVVRQEASRRIAASRRRRLGGRIRKRRRHRLVRFADRRRQRLDSGGRHPPRGFGGGVDRRRRRSDLGSLAESRVPADRQPQPRLRHSAAPAGLQHRRTDGHGEQVEGDLKPYWNVDPESDAAQALDYPVIGDFFFVARGRQVFMGIPSA